MTNLSQFILNHWELWLALLAIVVLIIINEMLARKHQAGKITAQMLVSLINHDNIAVYDLRSLEAFKEGHIIDACRVQKDEFDNKPLQKMKEKPFVLVCDNGIVSSSFGSELKTKGFNEVKVLQGGMRAWIEADLPLIKGK